MKGLFKFKDSANFWWRYYDSSGKRCCFATRTSDEVEAIGRVRAFQGGNLMRPLKGSFQQKDELTQVIERYLKAAQQREVKPMRKITAEGVRGVLNRFARSRALRFASEVNAKNLTARIAELRAQGKAQDTVFTNARDICAFSKWLAAEGLIPFDTLANFGRPQMSAKGRKNWVRMAAANLAITEATDPDLKFLLYCGFHAGLRKAEICAVRVGWFELGTNKPVLHVQNDPAAGFLLKDSDNRTIPLTAEFAAFLRVYLKDQLPSNYALRPLKTKGAHQYRVDFRKAFNSHMKRCEIRCTMHDMRRSFASNLVSKGISVYLVATWLGDRVDVVQRSYGYLESYNDQINVLQSRVSFQLSSSGRTRTCEGNREAFRGERSN